MRLVVGLTAMPDGVDPTLTVARMRSGPAVGGVTVGEGRLVGVAGRTVGLGGGDIAVDVAVGVIVATTEGTGGGEDGVELVAARAETGEPAAPDVLREPAQPATRRTKLRTYNQDDRLLRRRITCQL